MEVHIYKDPIELGKAAGKAAGKFIRSAILEEGTANIILATGTSQFETLNQLLKENIEWQKVIMFHLDEYIGLPDTHPASFRKYLKERFIAKVEPMKSVFLINGEADPEDECKKLGRILSEYPIDLALVGIGENGHLAFNDPPADFQIQEPYIVVELDDLCRNQQRNEGWFKNLEDVPKKAISMSIRQILKSKNIICSVPDKRKAKAVRDSLEKEVSSWRPASILTEHDNCFFYLDRSSAALLSENWS